jgi:hypothetical protein
MDSHDIIDYICISIKNKKSYLTKINNIHHIMYELFDFLSIKKNINYEIINRCKTKFNISLKNVANKDWPKHLYRIKGPAEYYKTNDMYIILSSGNPYLYMSE